MPTPQRSQRSLRSGVRRFRRHDRAHRDWTRRVDPHEQAELLAHGLRHAAIGAVVGIAAGCGSAAFLHLLTWATSTRARHAWLVWLLPAAGFALGALYHHVGGAAGRGTNLVLDELHGDAVTVPFRMGPLVCAGATATHLFGGSGGREGAAVQIAAALTAPVRRMLRDVDRRVAMVAAVAGGFGSVFGVPVAGAVFALEVQETGRQRYDGIVAALVASVVGDRLTRALGIHHVLPKPLPALELGPANALRITIASIAFGLLALAFIELTHMIRSALTTALQYPPARLAAGGLAVVVLAWVIGTRAYLGLSLPLIDVAVAGGTVATAAFAWKLVFTSVTIGSGFPGGEVTPLFCMGACLGNVLAGPLGASRAELGALGFVAVYAAASNTPIACTILAVETFGGSAIVPFAIACVVATQISGQRSVYGRQRVGVEAVGTRHTAATMDETDARRRSRASRDRPPPDRDGRGGERRDASQR